MIEVRDGRRHDFAVIYHHVVDDFGAIIGCHGLAVYMVLARHANNDSALAWPSIPTIARKTAMSENTVRKALGTLEAAGLISSVQAPKADTKGSPLPNRFVVMDVQNVSPEMIAEAVRRVECLKSSFPPLVQEVNHPGSGGEPPLVQEVNHPGSGGEPPLVQEVNPKKTQDKKTKEQDKGKIPPAPRGGTAKPISQTVRPKSPSPEAPRVSEFLRAVNEITPIGNWGMATKDAGPLFAITCAPSVMELVEAYRLWVSRRDVARYGCSLRSFGNSAGTLVIAARSYDPLAIPHETMHEEFERERREYAVRQGRLDMEVLDED